MTISIAERRKILVSNAKFWMSRGLDDMTPELWKMLMQDVESTIEVLEADQKARKMSSRPDLYPTTFEGWLAKTEEECGELIMAIGKYRRFGAVATDPKTGIFYDNIGDVVREGADVLVAVNRMIRSAPNVKPEEKSS